MAYDFDSIKLPEGCSKEENENIRPATFKCNADKSLRIEFFDRYDKKNKSYRSTGEFKDYLLPGWLMADLAKFLSEVYLDDVDKK